jgi:hypothetical protein
MLLHLLFNGEIMPKSQNLVRLQVLYLLLLLLKRRRSASASGSPSNRQGSLLR